MHCGFTDLEDPGPLHHLPLHPAHHCSFFKNHLYSSSFSSVAALEASSMQPIETGFHIRFCCVLLLMATEHSYLPGGAEAQCNVNHGVAATSFLQLRSNTCDAQSTHLKGKTMTSPQSRLHNHRWSIPRTFITLGRYSAPLSDYPWCIPSCPVTYFVTLWVAFMGAFYVHGITHCAVLVTGFFHLAWCCHTPPML